MKTKNIDLKWHVLHYDFNTDEIVSYNVLYGFNDVINKNVKNKTIHDRASLKEFLISEFRYHYWCRSEHEILVSGLHSKDLKNTKKIDVYYQLEMNLDRIVDYINVACNLNY